LCLIHIAANEENGHLDQAHEEEESKEYAHRDSLPQQTEGEAFGERGRTERNG